MAEDLETGVPETPASPPPEAPSRDTSSRVSGMSSPRKALEKNFEDARKAEAEQERPRKQTRGKGYQRSQPIETPQEGAEEAQAEPAEGEAPEAEAPELAPPDGWAADAKEAWSDTPPQVQAAVVKREQDITRGVQQLRSRYAEIDQALAPHMEVIQRYGQSPGQAVAQLFAWHNALTANPAQALPALAQSFGVDIRAFGAQAAQQWLAQQQQAQQQQAQQQAQQAGVPDEEISPAVRNYINQINTRLGQMQHYLAQVHNQQQQGQQGYQTLQQQLAEQNQQKTQDILDAWARGKPYFEEVRHHMAHLVGSGAIPLTADGKVDLDAAYDQAIWALPDIRSRIMADQERQRQATAKAKADKEKKALQEQAEKARRASGSLPLGAPGAPGPMPLRGKSVGKSVKESLMEAIAEHRD